MLLFSLLFFALTGTMVIKGKVTIKGNEPFSYVALTAENGSEYRLTGKLKDLIAEKYQNMILTVRGKIIKKQAGPGMPAEFEVNKIISASKEASSSHN